MSTLVDDKLIASIIGREDSDEIVCIDKFIGDEQMQLLASKLRGSALRNKKRMALRGNCIGSSGAKALSDLLRNNTSLEYVSLEWNQIGSSGCILLAEALKTNNTITHLDLRNNGISDDGAVAISSAINSSGKTLRVLDLRWNQISDRGSDSFHDAIVTSYPPLTVHLAGNNLSAQAIARLEEWTKPKSRPEPALPPPPVPVEEPSFSEDLLQAKVQNSLLKKDIEHLRQQNMLLQASIQGSETQLSNCALRITELEQHLMREESKNSQLHEALSDARERLAKITDEQGRLVSAWEVERNEWLAARKEAQREREAEHRTLMAERDSNRELARKAEESATRAGQQLTLLADQAERDRRQSQEELREALNRANDIAIQEAKLRNEVTALKSALTRATDRVTSLEGELAASQKASEEAIFVERRRNERDIEKLRLEFASQRASADERINKLSADATAARAALLEKETLFSKRQLEMQKEHDDAVEVTRHSERSRWESTVSDLKQRVDLLTIARRDSEERCASYIQEIKSLNDQHAASNAEMYGHISSLEEEMRRQRALTSTLKDALSAAESESKLKTMELEEVKKKFREADESIKALQRTLQEAALEKNHLKGQVTRMTETIAQATTRRRQEYATIEQSVKDAVSKEFETLQVRLQLLESSK